LHATLAPPIESLTVGRGALVNSHPTFGRRDTSFFIGRVHMTNLPRIVAFSPLCQFAPWLIRPLALSPPVPG